MTFQLRYEKLLIFLFVLSSIPLIAQKPDRLSFSIHDEIMEDALTVIGNKYGVSFSYDADLMAKEVISLSVTNLNLEQVLLKLLRQARFEFEYLDEEHVLIGKQTSAFREKYTRTIYLTVMDKTLNIALPNASVVLEDSRQYAATNPSGALQMKALFVDDDTLKISYMGYHPLRIPVRGKFQLPATKIYMETTEYQMPDVIITDNRKKKNLFTDDATLTAKQFSLKKMDVIGGFVEKDVFQTIQLLPGVIGSDESASLFNIRGGATGQNQVLVDDIKMYHFGHYFGKIAALNPHFIEKVTIYKDCYPAQYSGRVAGVIDIRSTDKVPEKFELSASANLLSGSFSATLPLFHKNAFLSIGYRHSFTGFLQSKTNKKMFDQVFQNSQITNDQSSIVLDSITGYVETHTKHKFGDWNIKYLQHFSKNTTLELNALHVHDMMTYIYAYVLDTLEKRDSLNIYNNGLSLNIRHQWSHAFSTSLISSYSGFSNNYVNRNELPGNSLVLFLHKFNNLADYSFKIINTHKKRNNTLNYGYELTSIDQGISAIEKWGSTNYEIFTDTLKAQNHSLFAGYNYQEDKFFGKISARLNYYDPTGKFYAETGFLIGLRSPDSSFLFKFTGGEYFQTLNQIIENNYLKAEDYLWVLTRNHHPDDSGRFSLVSNQQLSVGVEKILKNGHMGISLFKKKMEEIPSRIFKNEEYNPFLAIDLSAYGVEMDFSWRLKHFYTQLAYTYSIAKYHYDEKNFPTEYDKPHVLSIMQAINYKKMAFSINWHLSSGKPYTPIERIEWEDGEGEEGYYYFVYKGNNSGRLPFYSRLDASLTYQLPVKKIDVKLIVGLLNIFDRANILRRRYYIQYPNEYYHHELKALTADRLGLPRIINFSVLLDLNR